ncbi:MAG: C40 family peptidase [Defluviitaleaceae bacterium]|nr:C40 family peptidase [Defluviitaleaceae bacterium]
MSVVKTNVASMFKNNELQDEVLHGHSLSLEGDTATTFYGYKGILKKEDISFDNYEPTHIVISNFADVRENSNIKSKILITLVKGSYLKITKFSESINIILADGRVGYIDPRFIKELGIKDKNLIITNALSYLEVPYRWGGKTPLGVDCSGLVFMAYFLAGFVIYRDAQLKPPIVSIDPLEMQPTDLIFFEGHVAIYIGNSNIIHASAENGLVKIESLKRKDILKIGRYIF